MKNQTVMASGVAGSPQASGGTFPPQFAAPNTPLPRMPSIPDKKRLEGSVLVQRGLIPPPPPPYPGPPPPYPGQKMRVGAKPRPPVASRRPLLLQEQPLLLEDLLEEEKREQEKQAAGPSTNTSSAALMSDADFEMLRADVLGTNSQVSSPPTSIQGQSLSESVRAVGVGERGGPAHLATPHPRVTLFNVPLLAAPPLPPENIVSEQDRQAQAQYEQWLHKNNSTVTQQLKYYETEVQKLRKIRKSLNSKQRQLRKNGNELTQRDALELQRVTGEQTVLQKHLEAARKQSRQHSMAMQEYQNRQDQKGGGGSGGGSSPQSPALMSPGVAPSPQTSASPLPRIATPQSQSGDDKSEGGLSSPRPLPTPPSPQQYTPIRHPTMMPRFARSPEGGLRPRMLVAQIPGGTPVSYSSPRIFTSSPQPISSSSISQPQAQTIRLQAPQGLTPQHQQLLLQRQQLQQQKQQLLQQQQDLNQEQVVKQLQEGMQRPILQQRTLLQDDNLARQQQLHLLRQQQQLVQQNRQQLLQGKVGQFRQMIQQNQSGFPQTSPIQSQSPLGQLQVGSPNPMVTQAQSSMPPSPINGVQQFNPSSSPLHPQSPMLPQFQSSGSPMPQHSPRVQNYQTSNSPMTQTPQSPMVYSGLQTPNSPMPQFNQPISPMPPQSPRVQQYNQPPTSPMTPQSPMLQQQFVHRPNSPMPPRSPMPPMGSPMPMRRPSSTGGSVGSSPQRPQSVENPRTPEGGGGGGNPNMNPIPFPPGLFGRFGYFKLGLRGGSPMWSGKTPPRKALVKGGKVAEPSAGTSSQGSEENGKFSQKEPLSAIPLAKVASLVCVDYNDFDDESRTPPMTPPAKPALIKKAEAGTPKTRQSEDTDSEVTVYDDIVLVESCKEANLEVEELQSALEGNVMSTVVSMPMVIDPGHIQMMDVESDLLEDCLVSSTDLVVLDVDNGSNENECILEVVDKESDDILILGDGSIEEGLKVDESELMNNSEELMDLEEDLPSPPTGRKRMVGKVLPGESMMKEEEKQTSDSPDSPEDDVMEASPEPYIHGDSRTVSPIKEEKIDPFKNESINKVQRLRNQKSEEVIIPEERVPTIQPNVVVTRTPVAFTPVVTQKALPICTERRISIQQATVASLVQNAVNAAKLAAEQRAAAGNNNIESSTNNILQQHSTILTTNANVNASQFLPISVLSKNDKVGIKELRKDLEPHKTEATIHVIPNSSTDKILERKLSIEDERNAGIRKMFITDGKKITEKDLKLDIRQNDLDKRDFRNSADSKNNSDKNEESIFDVKFAKVPWEHGNFNIINREKLKPEDSHIVNDTAPKVLQLSATQIKLENIEKKDKVNDQIDERVTVDNKGSISLPCVTMSPSILEAQLTSMLRTNDQTATQKFVYTLINNRAPTTPNDIKKEVNTIKDHELQDDMRVEGLAAQFHRSVKTEELKLLSEIKKLEPEEHRNSKLQPTLSLKHGNIYVHSQIKSDTVMVGGKSYKIFQAGPQASTSDILNICDNMQQSSNKSDKIPSLNKIDDKSNSGDNLRAELPKSVQYSTEKSQDNNIKATPHSIIERRSSSTDSRSSVEMLQQRIVSSSEASEKETHHVSFNTAKTIHQKDDGKKFLPLSTMLLTKKEAEDKGARTPGGGRTPEDSQNVLLKQLLQNTGCATTTQSTLPTVPSLEAQLARPVPPTPSALIPPVLSEPQKHAEAPAHLKPQQQTREPVRESVVEELPPPPPVIKRELTQPGPVMSTMVEVKKEPAPLPPPAVTSPVVVEVKKEVVSSDEMLSPGLRLEPGEPVLQDLKKLKRRQYQQKRRQSLGKESIGGTPKKRPRKSSKVEEDYDSFIDSLMSQLRQTPAMTICEPNLTYNFTACPMFGSGDLGKVSSSTRFGELRGTYGNAYLPNENDYYNTLPFGDLPPRAPTTPSTQRGFYNEEFAPLKLHSTKDEFDERKFDYNRDRDNDTPDTIVSSSSPECIMPEVSQRFPGLQLIDSDSEEEKIKHSRYSPDIPIIAPLALRAKPVRIYSDMDKENEGPEGTRRHCDVTVTLTLSSQASDDVLSVLRNLANVLRIPVPANYSVTQRPQPPTSSLGMYTVKAKDGTQAAPVDIQSILNGAAKFCRHCDVIILNNLMRKKATEMPLVAKQGEEDLYFCSTTCYMQLALAHPNVISNEKIPTILERIEEDAPPKKIKLETNLESESKPEVKKDTPDSDVNESSLYMSTRGAGKRDKVQDKVLPLIPTKKSPSRYRVWTSSSIPPPTSRHKKPTDKEITEMLFRLGITVQPAKLPDDIRVCLFCHQTGDGVTDGPARLLNYDVNKWVHLNCALWSDEVYETQSGGLVNVETALQNGLNMSCAYCNTSGATLKCYKMRCSLVYHLPCAVKDQCVFYKNKTLYCSSHVPKKSECEKENELTTLSVMRRVYVSRDENRQVASIMHQAEQTNFMRIGSLIFLSVGQLLPHQLQAFHTPNYIYPIGYKIVRMYWSTRIVNKRCRYICSIHEAAGRPEFRIRVEERGEAELEVRDSSPRAAWLQLLEPLSQRRKTLASLQLFTQFISGEDLFGLTEPAIVRVLESLPGVETLTDYRFKYGRNPFLELPLAINPTGCARSEGRPKGHWKRAHTQRTCSVSLRPSFAPSTPLGESSCPYSKQFVHSKSSQYKKMKLEWRNNVFLARSKIQGLGLYAAKDLERHTMVIEYIGEIIRTELAEIREKQYEAKNRGIYMFRLDEERVVDATLCGGLARYINHSCSPNCVAETVEVDRDVRIIIFTKRRITRGEELAYDYKFDIEDDQHKIPCNCGASNCRKWMN